MFLGGFLTAVGFVAIAAKASPSFLKKVLGYDWIIDLACTVGIMAFLGSSGTISGMMIGVTTGLAISAVLFFAKKFWKYEKLDKNEEGKLTWVEYNGEWTIAFFISKVRAAFDSTIISDIKSEWSNSAKVAVSS